MFAFLVYGKFKFRKWEKMSPDERLSAFQELEKVQAKKLGRPECLIEPREMPENVKGTFSSRENKIYLNEIYFFDYRLRFDGMFTLFHEGRHAFQHYVCYTAQNPGFFSKARKWQQNFRGYIGGSLDEYAFYAMQPVERDANSYALKRLKSLEWRFGNDDYFNATVAFEERSNDNDKFRAKNDLGIFYRQKISKRTKENSEDF